MVAEGKVWRCPKCPRTFGRILQLLEHVKNAGHQPAPEEVQAAGNLKKYLEAAAARSENEVVFQKHFMEYSRNGGAWSFVVGDSIQKRLFTESDLHFFSVEPVLPRGLALCEQTGDISGVLQEAEHLQSYRIRAVVRDTEELIETSVQIRVGLLPPKRLSYGEIPLWIDLSSPVAVVSPEFEGHAGEFSVSPKFPEGIRLDSKTGVISGVPAVASDLQQFQVKVRNAGGECTCSIEFGVRAQLAVHYEEEELNVGQRIFLTPIVYGRVHSFVLSQPLLDGLTMESSTGIISGTLTKCIDASYQIMAYGPCGGWTISSVRLKSAIQHRGFHYGAEDTRDHWVDAGSEACLIPALDGYAASCFRISPCLPHGLRVDEETGVISGAPEEPHMLQTFSVTAEAADSAVLYLCELCLGVRPSVRIFYMPTWNPYLEPRKRCRQTPRCEGNLGEFIVFSAMPTLPDGFTVSEVDGTIMGNMSRETMQWEGNLLITCMTLPGELSKETWRQRLCDISKATQILFILNTLGGHASIDVLAEKMGRATWELTQFLRLDWIAWLFVIDSSKGTPEIGITKCFCQRHIFLQLLPKSRTFHLGYAADITVVAQQYCWIEPNEPRYGKLDCISVDRKSPKLPEGLRMDVFSGAICGKPEKAQENMVCFLIARDTNSWSRTQIRLTIKKPKTVTAETLTDSQKKVRDTMEYWRDRNGAPPVLEVKRNHLYEDSIRQLRSSDEFIWKAPLKVRFIDELGLDYGGLRKEWFRLIAREAFDLDKGFFVESEEHMWWFSANARLVHAPNWQAHYRFIGHVVGLALRDAQQIDLPLHPLIWDLLLETPHIDYFRALQAWDPELYKIKGRVAYSSSELVQDHDTPFQAWSQGELDPMELTMVYEDDIMNDQCALFLESENVQVSSENSHAYLQYWSKAKFVSRVKPEIDYFREGFHEACGGFQYIKDLTARELRFLICGQSEVDEEDLLAHIEFASSSEYGFSNEEKEWFKRALREPPPNLVEPLKLFLIFVTSTSQVPIGGCVNFRPNIHVIKSGDSSDHLPKSHTCSNTLELPVYPNAEHLRDKLWRAIHLGQCGFAML